METYIYEKELLSTTEKLITVPPHTFGSARYYGKPIVKEKLPGRNDLCPCDSGKKYKKCCINK